MSVSKESPKPGQASPLSVGQAPKDGRDEAQKFLATGGLPLSYLSSQSWTIQKASERRTTILSALHDLSEEHWQQSTWKRTVGPWEDEKGVI